MLLQEVISGLFCQNITQGIDLEKQLRQCEPVELPHLVASRSVCREDKLLCMASFLPAHCLWFVERSDWPLLGL